MKYIDDVYWTGVCENVGTVLCKFYNCGTHKMFKIHCNMLQSELFMFPVPSLLPPAHGFAEVFFRGITGIIIWQSVICPEFPMCIYGFAEASFTANMSTVGCCSLACVPNSHVKFII